MKHYKTKDVVLGPVVPSAAVTADFRRKMLALITDMHNSIKYWVVANYKANEPEIAQDEKLEPLPLVAAWSVPKNFTGVAKGNVGGNNSRGKIYYYAYVSGEMLRGKNGVGRAFESRESAERAVYENLKSPADTLQQSIAKHVKRWQAKIDDAAIKIADHFAKDISERSDAELKRVLKSGGISVDFSMTAAQQDIIDATVHQNVALIKSIPQQYLTQVEGIVMRSVQTGNDLKQLSDDLQKQFGVTKRRAHFIASDQNAKATSALNRARQIELGITHAIWMHSSAGKVPRPTHVKNDGKKYDVTKGWFDPAVGKHIFPGQLPNCRCFSKSVIKGFE